jgi:acetylornithine deacetylase/succinyl-diaminopimelate desuccinylase-like protein
VDACSTVGLVLDHVATMWEREVVPSLADYIAIPALSPMFDPAWVESGHVDAAVEHVRAWCAARPIDGLDVSVHRLPGRTPVIVAEVAPSSGVPDDTVLLYGHLDKQPPMDGWLEGLGPFTPVRRGDRLYGRGGADDGYAAFAALTAIEAIQQAGGRHARCVLVVEASEESGSPDLPAHIDALADRIGSPSLVVCLDSGCATYDRLWVTTSLRGLLGLSLRVRVLDEGVHSGSAGGVVPSSFRLLRQLLDRIEDAGTGELLLPELHADVPADRLDEMAATAAELGMEVAGAFPLVAGLQLQAGDEPAAILQARTWGPALAYVGAEGLPAMGIAGNVLRAETALKLSFRLPPTVDPLAAGEAVRAALAADPPSGAAVDVAVEDTGAGWNAPAFAPWLRQALDAGSEAAFGRPARTMGEGGSIPFMAMLGERFPEAQFVITGVLGPGANAHGPNEFLDIPCAIGVTTAVAHVVAAHAERPR